MFVKKLIDINKNDVLLAGGKGASLGEMLQNGIAVPSGLVVLSSAFNYFIEKSSLINDIPSIFKNINYSSYNDIEDASIKISNLILNTNLPKDLENQIITMYHKQDMEYVAVRSSATEEDNYLSTWAGQLDTFLNSDSHNLIQNIKKCWASLYSPRAINYRFQNKLQNKNISIAVVVQKMIQSEVSGICFTANPLINNTSQIVIEAGFGLGEAIVGGMITPDTYIINKNSNNNDFTIFSKKISTQTKQLVRKNNSIAEIDVPQHNQNTQKLDDINIFALSNIANTLEKHYNYPQDIEWGFDGHELFILQSRPITTLNNTPNKNYLMDYIQTKQWSFGIKANESLLFYSAKQQGYKNYMSKEFFQTNFVENLFITLKDDYPIRIVNTIQQNNFHKKAEQKIIEAPDIILTYINKNEKVWNKIATISDELLKSLNTNNNEHSNQLFRDIFKLYGLTSTLFNIIFVLGLKLTENKSTFENIDNILTIHDNWRNSIAAQEEKMGEIIFLFIDNLINNMKLTCNPLDIMNYLTLNDIKKLLKGQIKEDNLYKIINNRKNYGYVFVNMHSSNKNIIYNKSVSDEIRNYFLNMLTTSNINPENGFLNGQVTYPSNKKIKGKVIVIKDKDSLKIKGSLLNNKILVAIQTTPQYISYLRNAKAIITDEGGITCHAAIISRKKKKPCIVGTIHATKLLKDNDTIELDLNTGNIRIL